MADAMKLMEAIRGKLADLDERIRRHPYLEALEARRIGKDKLQLFAGQQYHIITNDLRSIALLVSRADSLPTQAFFLNALQGERAAFQALGAFARSLGMTEEALKMSEPLPGAFAYSAFVAWLALYGSFAEAVGAFLVNLGAWGANCARMSRALQARYDLMEADVAFFILFSSLPPGFEEGALQIIGEGLSKGVDPGLIRQAAKLLQGYELLYWDTLYQASA